MALTIRADTTEYIYSSVTADHDISGAGITVEVALPQQGTNPVTWYTAGITGTTQDAGAGTWTKTYRVLVGPIGGVVTLTAGSYDWIMRLNDTTEHPVRKAGTLTVT